MSHERFGRSTRWSASPLPIGQGPYLIEFSTALAASNLESHDPVEEQLGGLLGMLTNYEAARSKGAEADPKLDALIAERSAGTLRERAKALAACTMSKSH